MKSTWEGLIRSYGSTPKQLANSLDVSEEYIRRHFFYLYTIPSSKVLRGLSELTGIYTHELERIYIADRLSTRQSNHDLFHGNFSRLLPTSPVAELDFRICVASSLLGYCKLLCVNPISVEALSYPFPDWFHTIYASVCPHYSSREFFNA